MIKGIPWVTVLRQRLWGARKITDSLSASVKIDHTCEEEVDGSDHRHDARRMPRKGMSRIANLDPESSRARSYLALGLA